MTGTETAYDYNVSFWSIILVAIVICVASAIEFAQKGPRVRPAKPFSSNSI
jgi:hypothetical protein